MRVIIVNILTNFKKRNFMKSNLMKWVLGVAALGATVYVASWAWNKGKS